MSAIFLTHPLGVHVLDVHDGAELETGGFGVRLCFAPSGVDRVAACLGAKIAMGPDVELNAFDVMRAGRDDVDQKLLDLVQVGCLYGR